MIKKLIALATVAAVILGVLVYSQRRTVEFKVSGLVEADDIHVGSRVGGRVAKVHVQEGQAVAAGQLLAELEPYDLLDLAAQAQAQLAVREADLARLKAGPREEEIAQAKARRDELAAKLQELVNGPRKETIDAAKARLTQAQADNTYAQSNLVKARSLVEKNAASREELDKATQLADIAAGVVAMRQAELSELQAGTRSEDIETAKAQLEQAQQQLKLQTSGYRKEDIDAAVAAANAARAAVKLAQAQIAELNITAPLDGMIESFDLRPGDLVAPNAPALTMLAKGQLYVRAYLPETRLDIAVGRAMLVTTDSFPGRKFAGHVSFVSRQAEFTPANVQTDEKRAEQVFRLKVLLTEGLDVLRPGMPVDVWLAPEGAK